MQTGNLQFWNAERRFGFIRPDLGGPNVYCNANRM